jgi:hypothetical protein
VATGTAAEIIGDRQVAQVRCGDWKRAFALLDASGFTVQLYGEALRVGGPPAVVAGLLSRAGIDAVMEVVPADLEEAFVAIVAKPAVQ